MKKGFGKFVDVCFYIACFIMGATSVLVTLNVILRFLFNMEISWVLEVVEYGMAFTAMLAAPYVLKVEQHIVIDTALLIFKKKTQLFIHGLMSLVGAVTCALFAYGCALLTYQQFTKGVIMIDKTLHIPRYTIVWILPVGLILLMIQFILRASHFFHGHERTQGGHQGTLGESSD
jgi:C4-dicarboxylate transporter DctQ subunit